MRPESLPTTGNVSGDMPRFQVLALDGGGLKGIFSAAVLAAIESDLQTSITKHFDLIVGTSTGGILALGLGKGMRPHELVEFYVEHGPRVFSGAGSLGAQVKQWFKTKYDQKGLQDALHNVLGDTLLGDSKTRLVIPSFSLDDDAAYLFKTPHHETFRRDWRTPMWKVALATSAAPTYFPSSTHVGGIRHVDGGVWANNPILVGVAEAVAFCGSSLDRVRILSLGTTAAVDHRPERLTAGGYLQWATSSVDVLLRGQSQSATDIARHLLPQGHVTRLDPRVPAGLFALDRISTRELLARGQSESRRLLANAANLFNHTAAGYAPLYGIETDADLCRTTEDRRKEDRDGP